MTAKQRQLDAIHIEHEQDMETYCNLESEIQMREESIRSRVLKPVNVSHYLLAGRLVKVCEAFY